MKTICYCLTILLGVALLAPANSGNNCGSIEAKTITLRSDDGKHSLTLAAQKDSVGLWMRNEEKKVYAYMFSSDTFLPYFAIGNEKGADPIAIQADAGGPWVQIVADGKYNAIEAKDLLEVGKGKSKDKPRIKSARRRGGCQPANSGSCSTNSGGCSSCSAPATATLPAPATAGISASGCGSCANPATNVGSVRYLGPVPSNQSPRP